MAENTFFNPALNGHGRLKAIKGEGCIFNMLCPRYDEPLKPTCPVEPLTLPFYAPEGTSVAY